MFLAILQSTAHATKYANSISSDHFHPISSLFCFCLKIFQALVCPPLVSPFNICLRSQIKAHLSKGSLKERCLSAVLATLYVCGKVVLFASRERCFPLPSAIDIFKYCFKCSYFLYLWSHYRENPIVTFILYGGRTCRLLADLYISRVSVAKYFDRC